LEKVEVEYETMPGWMTDISKCKNMEELPVNAVKYIQRIEQVLGTKVEWIGVGPERDAMIYVKNK
jgi:adenylosuccinate synthase